MRMALLFVNAFLLAKLFYVLLWISCYVDIVIGEWSSVVVLTIRRDFLCYLRKHDPCFCKRPCCFVTSSLYVWSLHLLWAPHLGKVHSGRFSVYSLRCLCVCAHARVCDLRRYMTYDSNLRQWNTACWGRFFKLLSLKLVRIQTQRCLKS